LGQLENYFTKTNDVAGAEKIAQIRNKAETTGLTIKELNDIARLHGSELNAYNASGELASGLTKQAAENTRAGLKTTARGLFGDNTYKVIDSEISNTMRVRDLASKMVENVNKLQQKIKERGILEKLGRGVATTLDHMMGGGLKGFMQYFLPRGQGLKTLNALDLEKVLQKNLKTLQKLLGANVSDATLTSGIQSFLNQDAGEVLRKMPVGMSIGDVNNFAADEVIAKLQNAINNHRANPQINVEAFSDADDLVTQYQKRPTASTRILNEARQLTKILEQK
jgi:hypothetical protein